MTNGPVLFARYAYPPNALGYCGPEDSAELFEQAAAGHDTPDLRHLIRGFEGAWPYLALIAAAARREDPLDPEVVEAYWIGNPLLEAVGPRLLHASMDERFRSRLGVGEWGGLDAAFTEHARAHHGFHVFVVYPWVGLLRSGRVAEPLHVLDRCRIRWGVVDSVAPGSAVVRYRPLTFDGRTLRLGDPVPETVRCDGAVAPGDVCSLHWDWVCERLDPHRLAALQRQTVQQLAVANAAPRLAPALS
ncbi:DUF6390 family protein [Intrasporangium sp. DVR]|uniref:DUF6390 family protein n=1 Tax=Intrasporangium sp. DVR TaxID=3127867 RepID=UPI00313A60CD